MRTPFLLRIAFVCLTFIAGCVDHQPMPDPQTLAAHNYVGNLVSPFAITTGPNGYMWITEVGTGKNDGAVSAISPEGTVYRVFKGFTSDISEEEGLPDGLTHLTYKDGFLYVVQGIGGLLYKIDISHWQPGNEAPASSLPFEDIGSFVLMHAAETHLYNLTWGPEGDLYFTDAAANAIVHRKGPGDYSIFSTFAQVANPKFPAVGGPMTDFVPTGIAFDGSKFLVSSLTGFPFNNDKAIIQQVDMTSGANSVYKSNFTLLTDIALTPANKPLVLQFATFVLAPPPNGGFQPLMGKVLDENGGVLIDGLMMPTDIERTDDKTYFIVSMADNKITKLTY